MRVHSIQIGSPKKYGDPLSADPMKKAWTSAIFKMPIANEVQVTKFGLEGDSVADPRFHGGIDKAILAYSLSRYDYWREHQKDVEWVTGGFGENLTIEGCNEENVCIGDQYRLGESVIVEVSQPREPCFKIGRRWDNKMLPKLVAQTGFTGWYFRVIREGVLIPGEAIHLVGRPHEKWTVARANDFLFNRVDDPQALTELFLLPELSQAWKKALG
jgi:MOSC domain-containing protein YiiM